MTLRMPMSKTLKFSDSHPLEPGSAYDTIRMRANADGKCVIDMIMTALYPHAHCKRTQRDRVISQIKKIDSNYESGVSCQTIVQWIKENKIDASFYAFTPGGKLITKHVGHRTRKQMVIIVNNKHCYLIEDHANS